jgi:hypothetical protein
MITTRKPMTEKQLRDVVAQYFGEFPDWTMSGGVAFVRESGPIQQMIWFQKMSYAAYRPTHVVRVLPISLPRMLTQDLDVRHRETRYGLHEREWLGVVRAMEQQFKPDIRRPLDVADVLLLCEKEARNTANDLLMLAILYAWLGRKAEAHDCCEKLQVTPPPTLAPIPEWEASMRSFGRELAMAMEQGTERLLLERRTSQ